MRMSNKVALVFCGASLLVIAVLLAVLTLV
jgi:hypothetical protein